MKIRIDGTFHRRVDVPVINFLYVIIYYLFFFFSREMMIVFVYDTECSTEGDDLTNSVLYFHPSWVSDLQKLSLCGQLMGTTHFLKDSFFPPKIISLQSGKFVIKNFGRFILVSVVCSENIFI